MKKLVRAAAIAVQLARHHTIVENQRLRRKRSRPAYLHKREMDVITVLYVNDMAVTGANLTAIKKMIT